MEFLNKNFNNIKHYWDLNIQLIFVVLLVTIPIYNIVKN